MKNLAVLFSLIILASGSCLALTSAFTYQGKLGNSGTPATARVWEVVKGRCRVCQRALPVSHRKFSARSRF